MQRGSAHEATRSRHADSRTDHGWFPNRGVCGHLDGARSTGEVIDDAAITTKVKSSLLADTEVSGLGINVDTSKGGVSLTGIVDSERQRQRAIQLVQGVAGVRRIEARNLFVKRWADGRAMMPAAAASGGQLASRGMRPTDSCETSSPLSDSPDDSLLLSAGRA
jgi:hyperosmotically inducible periplasmic protein